VSRDDPFGGRHPRDRAIEPEDPMLLSAEPADGDPLLMLDGIVEEYAGLGWDKPRILRIFATPLFQATWGLARLLGPAVVEARVDAVLARRGRMRFRTAYPPAATSACGDAAGVPDVLDVPPPHAGRAGEEGHDA